MQQAVPQETSGWYVLPITDRIVSLNKQTEWGETKLIDLNRWTDERQKLIIVHTKQIREIICFKVLFKLWLDKCILANPANWVQNGK